MSIIEKAGGVFPQRLMLPLAARVTANLYTNYHWWAFSCRGLNLDQCCADWEKQAARIPHFGGTISQLLEVIKGVDNGSCGNGVSFRDMTCRFVGAQEPYSRDLLAQLLIARTAGTDKNCPTQSWVEQEVSRMADELGLEGGCFSNQNDGGLSLSRVTRAILSGHLLLPSSIS